MSSTSDEEPTMEEALLRLIGGIMFFALFEIILSILNILQAERVVKIIFGVMFGGTTVIAVIRIIISNLIMKAEKKTENEDKETKTELLSELAVFNHKQAGAHVVDIEAAAGVDYSTVKIFIEHMLEEKPTRFPSLSLEIFTSNYSVKLGEGGYGAVYKGHFPDGQTLAVKVLNNYGIYKRIEGQFMAKVNTIGRNYHQNLVRLYGFCFEAKTKALVYEYMENGSLDKLLFESKKHENEIKWDKLYEIAIGAARGLEYLHHFSRRRIIHYDIKPANVLLDSNFCPKIADFGLAKLCNRDTTYITMSRVRGTPGYAAPEVWMPFPVSYKCDVYSFGVMLFEIVGRRRNFDVSLGESQEWFPKHVWEKFDKGELEDVLGNCEIDEKDWEKAKTMVKVALWCVQYLPEARPSMRDVVKILEGGAEAGTPPNPFHHLISSVNNISSCIVGSSNSTIDYDDEGNRNDTTIMRKYEIKYATP
ncbi:hypothetical protein REPUB_Repub15cG0117100 [Reevesia pubescens]